MTSAWVDACLAAALVAVDGRGLGGIRVRSRAGPVRDRWLDELARCLGPEVPIRRVAGGIAAERLVGGLDLAATLGRGRPVAEPGLLEAVDGGCLVVAMAERLDRTAAGVIAAALDEKLVRFALIALDESAEDDERLVPVLADRLGLVVDLDALSWRETARTIVTPDIRAARSRLGAVEMGEDVVAALASAATALGLASLRAPLHLVRAARAVAALRGVTHVEAEDAVAALRLVLGVRLPDPAESAAEAEEPASHAPPEDGVAPRDPDREPAPATDGVAPDVVLDAVRTVLPRNVLLALQATSRERAKRGIAGKAGATEAHGRRGRALTPSARKPVPDARIDLLATLRQAAPWQLIRARTGMQEASPSKRLHVRKDDFRFVRARTKTGTTAIFAVDASGSAAVERLAEAKGAVEHLLAECYVRRDSVALIAFRGRRAETLLEPTRSLVRAKRCLAALPGGGGTPLADGILLASRVAAASVRKGQDAIVVFLTDGRGNVALDGTSAADKLAADLAGAALRFRQSGVRAILIDTARRAQPRTAELARNLGAEYLALPQGGARSLAQEVGARMKA
ncbi:magnesium chelatase subunit D [Aureimonas leprariae]|uniref:Magnesium chelatase subunit D n=1 Tax=Plantimonas leprariae TaxID=2615207 RepID=A0A7V7PQC4_9HYPH|nr:magnesium chelatase subunit D [Aureimonas leprariae]KAB0680312.1 magnesium chelatase subunit D [Aureimonas leprariae]